MEALDHSLKGNELIWNFSTKIDIDFHLPIGLDYHPYVY